MFKNGSRVFIILALLFIASGNALSQLSDTTCLDARWLAIKPVGKNKQIFNLGTSSPDSLDLIHTIKRLVEKGELDIYAQNNSANNALDWSYIDYDLELEKIRKDSFSLGANPYFEITQPVDYALTNIFGEDSLILDKDGFWVTVYPHPKIFVFTSSQCDEIHIKEKRVFNQETGKYIFNPVGISFYFKGTKYSRGHERFWVMLDELFDALENSGLYPWYEPLKNKNYFGFQYMKTSCYDPEIKY